MTAPVLLDISDRIALLTLNRPERLNALSYGLIDALMAALDRIETDPDVRAVILTGAGDRAFSAGADISEFSDSVRHGRATALRDFVRRGQAMTARLEAFRKPVIAAINGLAFGGGCEITEAVHLALASDRASFAKPEIRLGMPPTFGGTQRLPRLVGRKRGLELLLTGDPFPAHRALDIGLVNAVVPHDELLPAAQAIAGRIIRHGADAVASVITAATRGLNMAISEGLQLEAEQFASLVGSRDLEDGLRAWRDRRDQTGWPGDLRAKPSNASSSRSRQA
ncbi:crotonase/enoyl-CoA hydratase family protein [Bradyrhizobium sp. HKCCYLS20291]|uniref:crotonase/enoyl-CoA hydratase family protein n=1 Tax=Bradyrhizobium sp. HKCCYLS20291 TaxID=3420766 RepID=UPI003EBFBDD2